MNRKTFLKKSSTALLFGIPLLSLWNCSDNSEDDMDPNDNGGAEKSCVDNGTSTRIANNHGHSMSVPKEHVTDGSTRTYDIGGSSHQHNVTVTSSHFSSLKDNESVTVTSSDDGGHTHSVTITCA